MEIEKLNYPVFAFGKTDQKHMIGEKNITMGLFDLFKKPPTIQDGYFGTLTFMKFRDSSKNYFEGKGIFNPTGDEISYSIDGQLSGPTNDQRDFYKKVQDSYDQIIPKIIPIIENEFNNWKDDFKIKDFKKEFRLVDVKIPSLQSKPILWEMSFETIHDDEHLIIVDFKDFEPDNIMVDG